MSIRKNLENKLKFLKRKNVLLAGVGSLIMFYSTFVGGCSDLNKNNIEENKSKYENALIVSPLGFSFDDQVVLQSGLNVEKSLFGDRYRFTNNFSCLDTDVDEKNVSGKNLDVKGDVYFLNDCGILRKVFGDKCNRNGGLSEGFCENNKLVVENYRCNNGCLDGACVKDCVSEISEDKECGKFIDNCGKISDLGECSNDKECLENKCFGCTDTDFSYKDVYKYINKFEKGEVVGLDTLGNIITRIDYCVNDKKVKEYFCKENDLVVQMSLSCEGSSVCLDGACVNENMRCFDNDDQDKDIRSSVVGVNEYDKEYNIFDYCLSKYILNEKVCNDDVSETLRIECENGCLNGKCLTDNEVFPDCLDLVEGHNSPDENRINLVFVGHMFENINDLKDRANYLIEGNGLFSLEPFLSNRNLFNFWFVNESYELSQNKENCPSVDTNLEDSCDLKNIYAINICNYKTSKVGRRSGNEVSLNINSGRGVMSHELGGHIIGGLADVYPGSHGSPNAANDIDEAIGWWKEYIGNGCGEPGVVDCDPDDENYNVEVSYVSGEFEKCFKDGPIEGCQVSSREYILDESSDVIKYDIRMIGFQAQDKNECLNGSKYCIYSEEDNFYCKVPYLEESENCEDRINYDVYGNNLENPAEKDYQFLIRENIIRPHLDSVMYSAGEDTSFGEVNEREICKKMENLLMTSLDYCGKFESN